MQTPTPSLPIRAVFAPPSRFIPCIHPSILSALLLALSLPAIPAFAGNINGVVRESESSMGVPGATVYIPDTTYSTQTDASGRFTMIDVPEGKVTLRSSTIEYDAATAVADVPASGAVDVQLTVKSAVVKMDKITIEGYREGRSLALQQKRGADNIMDVVSADSVGNLPDRNAAEAISRVPGVSLSLGDGEGQYVSIRGMEPNLNQITVDGATMAAPGGARTGRAVPLDVMSASQISKLEVVKSVTPDMDANALGGSINIVTASGFDRSNMYMSGKLQGSYNDLAEKFNYSGNFMLGTTFANRTIGLAVAVNYDKRNYRTDYEQANGWKDTLFNGSKVYLPTGFELYSQVSDRANYGATLNFEYRPTKSTIFYVRPNYTHTTRHQDEQSILYSGYSLDTLASNVAKGKPGDPVTLVLTSPTTGQFTSKSKGRVERREVRTEENTDLFNISTGAKTTFGQFTIEPMVNYSKSMQKRPYTNGLQFRSDSGNGALVDFDVSDFADWRWDAPEATRTPSKFPYRISRQDTKDVEEDIYAGKLDVRWDTNNLLFGKPGFVKFGGKIISRDRNSTNPSYRLIPNGTAFTLADVTVDPNGSSIMGGLYNTGFNIDWDKTWGYIANNPSKTQYSMEDSVPNSIEDDYKVNEKIYALYGMATLRITPKLTLLGGLRWEYTDDSLEAKHSDYLNGKFVGISPVRGSTSYDYFLPNIQVKYTVTKQFLLRAAITTTLARPAYEDSRPLESFSPIKTDISKNTPDKYDPAYPYEGTLKQGSPDLKAYQSVNFDLSAEYANKHHGFVSMGLFRKNISNPIYTYKDRFNDREYLGYKMWQLDVEGKQNADNAYVQGVELCLYQPLETFPSPLDGFAIDINATFQKSDVKIPFRSTEKFSLFRQPSTIGNVALVYEKYGFSTRVAWHYEDGQFWTVATDANMDVYRRPSSRFDFQLRYRFTKNLSATFAIRNFTDEREEYTYGKHTGWLRTTQMYGRDYNLNISYNF